MSHLQSYRANLEVRSVEELTTYLREQLAFEVDLIEGEPAFLALVRCGDVALAVVQSDNPGVNSTTAGYVGVDDVDTLHADCVDRGLTIAVPLTDHPWGLRDFVLEVPGGHRLAFGQQIPDVARDGEVDASKSLLNQLDLASLVGLEVDEARRRVQRAGARLRVVNPGDMYTLEFRPDRVTVRADGGTVIDVAGIG
jgi:hypothetical protein